MKRAADGRTGVQGVEEHARWIDDVRVLVQADAPEDGRQHIHHRMAVVALQARHNIEGGVVDALHIYTRQVCLDIIGQWGDGKPIWTEASLRAPVDVSQAKGEAARAVGVLVEEELATCREIDVA